MSTKYVLALDQGTTSSRAILFDNEQNIIAVQQREFEQIYPQQGWVEHNPMEIWSTQYGVMNEVVAQSGVDVHDIAAIGITNQRETTILWEKATGRPIYNAIVWQCRRTAPLVDELVQQPGMTEYIRENTGLMPDAYFSATKIKWILDNVPGARERAEAGEILFGTVDTWLVWKLTGGKVHVTDRTNASRTMLYNIRTLDWDDTLLKALDIPRCILPRVADSSEVYGTTDLCGVQVPVAGIAGDQQAALFGQGCFAKGEAKNTYGTGCFLLMNTGDTICRSQNGLQTALHEGGSNLSGGQRQRLALARALLHDSPVYIFDEATSNIDVESENDIMAQIQALAGKKTVILISHRLANVTAADNIYVLDHGSLAEQGTHEALLAAGGTYARLWTQQQELENYGKEEASHA